MKYSALSAELFTKCHTGRNRKMAEEKADLWRENTGVMFENDYVMRMIKEMVRTLLKLICQIDTEKTEELHLEKEVAEELDRLQKLVDDGLINQAENELLEELNTKNKQDFQLALLFYEYLNRKDTEFLKSCDFSREEISQGIKTVTEKYGYGSMLGAFTEEGNL